MPKTFAEAMVLIARVEEESELFSSEGLERFQLAKAIGFDVSLSEFHQARVSKGNKIARLGYRAIDMEAIIKLVNEIGEELLKDYILQSREKRDELYHNSLASKREKAEPYFKYAVQDNHNFFGYSEIIYTIKTGKKYRYKYNADNGFYIERMPEFRTIDIAAFEETKIKDVPAGVSVAKLRELKKHHDNGVFDYFTIGKLSSDGKENVFGRINESDYTIWHVMEWE